MTICLYMTVTYYYTYYYIILHYSASYSMIQTHQHSEFGPVPTLLMRPPFPLPPFPMMLPKGDLMDLSEEKKSEKVPCSLMLASPFFFGICSSLKLRNEPKIHVHEASFLAQLPMSETTLPLKLIQQIYHPLNGWCSWDIPHSWSMINP